MADRNPDLLPLRVRVIELLTERGRYSEALGHCATALSREPGNLQVLELLQQCTAALSGGTFTAPDPGAAESNGTAPAPRAAESSDIVTEPVPGAAEPSGTAAPAPAAGPNDTVTGAAPGVPEPSGTVTEPVSGAAESSGTAAAPAPAAESNGTVTGAVPGAAESSGAVAEPALHAAEPNATATAPDSGASDTNYGAAERDSDRERDRAGFDWEAAEEQVGDIIAPAFVDEGESAVVAEGDVGLFERPGVTLADVGGMDAVKRQLELSLLGPLRNPELARAFGTSARGGLLLYGPPGCGKTFLASAIAGELGANFYPIEIADILDIYTGASERNLHQVFQAARRNAPCVLFIDEVDALGHKRSQMSASATMRTVVNQLLTEMDSFTGNNDGLYILAATNHPWDVDVALRRPGRFDRMILVTLPDLGARKAILHHHLRDRPVAGIDLGAIAKRTDGFSGADLAHICTSATQLAMAESIRTGTVLPVTMRDIETALAQVRPSTGAWFESARNVVEFANNDGTYDELAKYMRDKKFR
ncbi:AAA family ATPase [Nocardia terpenica]|uniref:AAA family ATPase n=1 Tax=Nocardia terpenica TaxID=455432 RepID=A0A6G9ZEF5_9NOCA|nr:AAA family ATPase [Nocardia terpenica]